MGVGLRRGLFPGLILALVELLEILLICVLPAAKDDVAAWALVCMTKCMAAPSEALAHSPATLVRGAHRAISLDVLVPQANRSSMVPITRKARPATNATAASGRNGPMTWAPAMKKSPKMPPSPLGNGQLFGWGSAASAAASKITEAGQARSLSLRRFGVVRNRRCHPHAASGKNR